MIIIIVMEIKIIIIIIMIIIIPYPFTRAVYAGFMIQRHPHLAAWNVHFQCLPVIPVLPFPVIPVSPFPVVPVPPFPVILCALIIPSVCA